MVLDNADHAAFTSCLVGRSPLLEGRDGGKAPERAQLARGQARYAAHHREVSMRQADHSSHSAFRTEARGDEQPRVGGTDELNAIASRFAALFGLRVPRGCRSYTPDQRFWIAATARGRYSDGSIICGKPVHPTHDSQATTNPSVVIEVPSPSSEGDDDGDKRRDFQSLASLQASVLAAQDARSVKVYRRTERGEWRDEPDIYRDGESFELPTLTRSIAVDEVYDDILDAAGHSLLG